MILDIAGMLCGCEVELINDVIMNGKPVWIITDICDHHNKLFKEFHQMTLFVNLV